MPIRPVVLADGRTWGLALPEVRYRPDSGAASDGAIGTNQLFRVAVRSGYPWPIEHLVERLHVACGAGPGSSGDRERFNALMALASALLRRAHDLDSDEAATLLALDGEGSTRLVDAVLDAVGCPPAPFPLGGADV